MSQNADVHYLAADIARRVPEMAKESSLNLQSVLINMIQDVVDRQVLLATDQLHVMLWNAGWCDRCNSEITHDITEPFSSCNCGGTSEATVVPIIPALRHDLAVKEAAIVALQRECDSLKAGVRTALGVTGQTLPEPKPCDPHTPH